MINEEKTIFDLLLLFKKNILFIILFTATGSIGAIFYSLSLDNYFSSTATITINTGETSSSEMPGLANLSKSIGGFGGFSTPGNNKKAIYLEMLNSRKFLNEFIKNENAMPVIFKDMWDSENKNWAVSHDKIPTIWLAYNEFIEENFNVVEDDLTGIVRITLTTTDATLSSSWAMKIITSINEAISLKNAKEINDNILFLTEKITTSKMQEIRNTASVLLQQQMKKQMLNRSTDIFDVIDPAFIPQKKSGP